MTPRKRGEIRPGQLAFARCPACGKSCYYSRTDAKRAARLLFPEDALRAYQCGTWWHFGHTADWRKRGERRPK